MTKHDQQADGEIHEDQLLNFLVNALTGAFGVSLGENADLDPEDIYKVLVGATADGTSISTLCRRSEDGPSGTNILRHLRTKFDLEKTKQRISTTAKPRTAPLPSTRTRHWSSIASTSNSKLSTSTANSTTASASR